MRVRGVVGRDSRRDGSAGVGRRVPAWHALRGTRTRNPPSDAGTSSPTKEGPEGLLSDCPPDEMSGDECWDLEPTPTGLRGGGEAARPFKGPQQLAGGAGGSSDLVGTRRRKLRKRAGTTRDQDWEEARRNAWLRQMLSDTSSDEDEGEEHYGRFAESGRWAAELYKIPQYSAPTSEGECSV